MIDKKLESKLPLTYNVGLHDSNTSIVTGKITAVGLTRNFDMISVQFTYFDDTGAVISKSAWNIEGALNINDLWAQITPLLPPPVSKAQDTLNEYYTGFLLIASESWENNVSDWQLVDDIP
jgi:hypothetical protein